MVALAALVANEADTACKACDAVVALLAQLAVPKREPVKLVAVTLPLMLREPVTVWISAIILPILTPVFVTWNSIPLPVITVNEPEIMVLPLTSSLAPGDVVPMPRFLSVYTIPVPSAVRYKLAFEPFAVDIFLPDAIKKSELKKV